MRHAVECNTGATSKGLDAVKEDWPVWPLQRHDFTHAHSALHLRIIQGDGTGQGHEPMCKFLNLPRSSPGNGVNRCNAHQACKDRATTSSSCTIKQFADVYA